MKRWMDRIKAMSHGQILRGLRELFVRFFIYFIIINKLLLQANKRKRRMESVRKKDEERRKGEKTNCGS